jgi:hypothetical protein
MQIAALQVLDGGCQQPYGRGNAAQGMKEIDPAAP